MPPAVPAATPPMGQTTMPPMTVRTLIAREDSQIFPS